MEKGQGSLEYLLILAAILAIAVAVVLVANQMMTPAEERGKISEDKHKCSLAGIELNGYDSRYDGTSETVPDSISLTNSGEELERNGGTESTSEKPASASCEIGKQKFELKVTNRGRTAYLNNSTDNAWFRYGTPLENGETETIYYNYTLTAASGTDRYSCGGGEIDPYEGDRLLTFKNTSTIPLGTQFDRMNVSVNVTDEYCEGEYCDILINSSIKSIKGGVNELNISGLADEISDPKKIRLNFSSDLNKECYICSLHSIDPPNVTVWETN